MRITERLAQLAAEDFVRQCAASSRPTTPIDDLLAAAQTWADDNARTAFGRGVLIASARRLKVPLRFERRNCFIGLTARATQHDER